MGDGVAEASRAGPEGWFADEGGGGEVEAGGKPKEEGRQWVEGSVEEEESSRRKTRNVSRKTGPHAIG
jgi:hypothetical protein